MDVEPGASDQGFLGAVGVEVIARNGEQTELGFELVEIDADVDQCPQEHIAADAAEQVEVERLHSGSGVEQRALIWAAA
jgi:hypothetical protein